MTPPSVFSYLDYRSFLQDWFNAKKREVQGYSYAQFADEGGCSKSALANVLSGARTPRAATLDAFGRAMDLTPPERNYLGLLVELSSAADLDRRREVMEQILASERYRQVRYAENESDSTVFRYVEHWYIPAIREMASLPGFRADPAWIAPRMRPRITTEQARDALDRLIGLDFLRVDPDGHVEVREVQFRTKPDTTQSAILHFHRTQIPELLGHIQSENGYEQHLQTGTITLPADLVPEVKARIDRFFAQLLAMADAERSASGARAYQVAVQFLPVSEVVG